MTAPARPQATPPPRRVHALARFELRLLLRNPENVLVALAVPVGLLVFFSLVDVLPTDQRAALGFLLPRMLAVAVGASAMVALGIATAFERHYLVLRRLAVSPLSRREVVAAKTLAVFALQGLQVGALVLTAALLRGLGGLGLQAPEGADGWAVALAGVVLALLLGTATFTGLGLLLAGRLPAMTALTVINALFVALLLAGGWLVPLEVLPPALAVPAQWLPAAPLAATFEAAVSGHLPPASEFARLAAWAVAAPAAAAWAFRWE